MKLFVICQIVVIKMNNKILIKLLVLEMDETYDIFIPINVRVGTALNLINRILYDISDGIYEIKNNRNLYNIVDANPYPLNKLVRETNIRTGSSVIII